MPIKPFRVIVPADIALTLVNECMIRGETTMLAEVTVEVEPIEGTYSYQDGEGRQIANRMIAHLNTYLIIKEIETNETLPDTT